MNNSSGLTNSSQENETDTMLPKEATALLIWQVFPPILLFIGTVGNILSIIVLSRRSMRRSGVSMYLICLAVSDLLVLYIGLLRQWINYMFFIDIRELHPAICKLNLWLVYFSLDMSAWILVSVTVERAISVWLPHRVKIICTRRVFVTNIVFLVVALMLVNGHFLFGVGDNNVDGILLRCANLSSTYAEFLDFIFPWIDLCFFSIGPFLFHLVGNVLIVSRLVAGVRTIQQLNMASTEQRVERRRQMSSMTTMLLSLNLVYLICTLPISIYLIYTGYWEQDKSREAEAHRSLVYACANFLMYLNNSTNFITYTVSGRRFRSELFALVRGQTLRLASSFTFTSSMSNLSRSRSPRSSYISTVT